MASNDSGLPVNLYLAVTPLPYAFQDHRERLKPISDYGSSGARIVDLVYGSHKKLALQASGWKAPKPITFEEAHELLENGKTEGRDIWVTVGFVKIPEVYKETLKLVNFDYKTIAAMTEGEWCVHAPIVDMVWISNLGVIESMTITQFESRWQLMAFEGSPPPSNPSYPPGKFVTLIMSIWDSGA